jgi:hypothetical protein
VVAATRLPSTEEYCRGVKYNTVPLIFKYVDYPSVEPFMYMVTLEENCELTISLNSHTMAFKGSFEAAS